MYNIHTDKCHKIDNKTDINYITFIIQKEFYNTLCNTICTESVSKFQYRCTAFSAPNVKLGIFTGETKN